MLLAVIPSVPRRLHYGADVLMCAVLVYMVVQQVELHVRETLGTPPQLPGGDSTQP